MKGKVLIFSAPSGSGKTTIVKHLLKTFPILQFSVSACSREKRAGEIHGKDYFFLSAGEFKEKIENKEFLEWEEVYPGHFYGTLRSELPRIWDAGNIVIFDVDVVGGLNIRKQFPTDSLAVFVQPPTLQELEKRLKARSTESGESLKKRLAKAKQEMEYAKEFDIILVNDNLKKALDGAVKIVSDFLKKHNK